MEEHDLGHRKAAVHHHLVDIGRPFRLRLIAELGVEGEVLALLGEVRRRVEARVGIGGLPFAEEEMMDRVGRDQEAHRPERIDFLAEGALSAIGDQTKSPPSVSRITAMRVG